MKNFLLLGLTLLSLQTAFADERNPRDPREPRDPRPPMGNDRQDDRQRNDLAMCLKDLNKAQNTITDLSIQLNQCRTSNNPGELDMLRRDVQRLRQDNAQLQNENMDLRRQLENQRPPQMSEYFSYGACVSSNGTVDTRYVGSATGIVPVEAETKALSEVQRLYKCNYGVRIIKTEEVRSSQPMNYCSAGCLSSNGVIDTRYLSGERGRNQTEAAFLALKKAQTAYSCNYGVQVQVCQ